MRAKESSSQDSSMLDYLYRKRNDRDSFVRYGEFTQSGDSEVCLTESDANTSLLPSQSVEYSDDDDEMPVTANREIYEYDSDEGKTSFFIPPRRRDVKSPRKERLQRVPSEQRSREEEVRERRRTMPSQNMLVPTENMWKWCVCWSCLVVLKGWDSVIDYEGFESEWVIGRMVVVSRRMEIMGLHIAATPFNDVNRYLSIRRPHLCQWLDDFVSGSNDVHTSQLMEGFHKHRNTHAPL